MTLLKNEKRERIGWIDLLRVLACFLVIVSHCSDPFIAQFDADRSAFLTGVFTGSLMRPCVPLFVMMTGVLLLPVRTVSLGEFYRKRIGRILRSLIFWSLVLPILFFVYYRYIGPDTQNPLVSLPDHDTRSLIEKLYTFVFNFNFDTVPLWYLYMLIGLYLVMPILSRWLVEASRKELRLVLSFWVVSLALPYVKIAAPLLGYQGNYGNMGILGICDWNEFGVFYYMSGYAGYLVLAYYLVKYPPEWSWKKTLEICIPMFLAGYAVTALGYVFTQELFPGNYAYLEIVWYFTGINVLMMTFPIFLIVRRIEIPSRPWLSHLSGLSFGIYLCHYIFVFIGYDIFRISEWPGLARILAAACFAFAASYLVTRLLSGRKATRAFVN